jgi:hypothetical protein
VLYAVLRARNKTSAPVGCGKKATPQSRRH